MRGFGQAAFRNSPYSVSISSQFFHFPLAKACVSLHFLFRTFNCQRRRGSCFEDQSQLREKRLCSFVRHTALGKVLLLVERFRYSSMALGILFDGKVILVIAAQK